MTDVTRPSVRNLLLFCDFELRTLSQNYGASIILFKCYVLDRIRAECCPFLSSTNPSNGRRSSWQSDRQIHRKNYQFFSMSCSISTSKIWSVTQKNDHPLRDGHCDNHLSTQEMRCCLSLIQGHVFVILFVGG